VVDGLSDVEVCKVSILFLSIELLYGKATKFNRPRQSGDADFLVGMMLFRGRDFGRLQVEEGCFEEVALPIEDYPLSRLNENIGAMGIDHGDTANPDCPIGHAILVLIGVNDRLTRRTPPQCAPVW
jgi:hypothetical protein